MRLAARQDNNHKLIRAAFEGLGCSVSDTSRLGRGFPDMVIGIDKVTVVVEIKDGNAPLTEAQQEFYASFRGAKAVVRSVEDAGLLVRAIKIVRSPKGKEK